MQQVAVSGWILPSCEAQTVCLLIFVVIAGFRQSDKPWRGWVVFFLSVLTSLNRHGGGGKGKLAVFHHFFFFQSEEIMAMEVVAKISRMYMLMTVGNRAAALSPGCALCIWLQSFTGNLFVIRKCAKFLWLNTEAAQLPVTVVAWVQWRRQ